MNHPIHHTKTASWTLLLAGALLWAGCQSTRQAQDAAEAMTMEEELVARNIEARGGLENIQALQTQVLEGTMLMDAMGQQLDLGLVIYKKRPNMTRSEVDIPAMGMLVVNGFDGETAWMDNPMAGGLQKAPEAQARLTRQQADFDGVLVGYKDRGITLAYEGEAVVRETPAHKLKITLPDSTESYLYLDAETYLEIKAEGEGIDPQSGSLTRTETFISDYRDVDGVMVPFALEVSIGSILQDIAFEKVTHNVEVPDSMFVFPEK